MERQDANVQAYHSDVTAKMLLSGAVTPPEWAAAFIGTLEACTGLPGHRQWVGDEAPRTPGGGYLFGSSESSRVENVPKSKNKNRPSVGSRNSSYGSYFDFSESTDPQSDWRSRTADRFASSSDGRPRASTYPSKDRESPAKVNADEPTTDFFETKFDSDFSPDSAPRKHPRFSLSSVPPSSSPFRSNAPDSLSHKRSVSAYTPPTSSRLAHSNPFESYSTLR